jgi:VCBS repeat-containing protein
VTPVNDAPVAADQSISVAGESSNNLGLLGASDLDGDSFSFSAVDAPAHGSVTVDANGVFHYTPDALYEGADSFTFKANDGSVDSNTATVSVTVTHTNHAPTAAAGTLTVDEDSVDNGGDAGGSDVDGETLTYSKSPFFGPFHGTAVVNTDGSYTYTPTANYHGTDSFAYIVTDGSLSAQALVSITVNSVDDAPMAVAGSFTTNRSTVQTGSVGATDVEGDPLTYAVAVAPVHGLLTLQTDGTFSYQPTTGYAGPDSFQFTANDGSVDSAPGAVAITVVEHAPVPAALKFTMTHNTTHKGKVTATDADIHDKLKFTRGIAPKHGTLILGTTGSFSYKPVTGFKGKDSFSFKVSDGLKSKSATVSITVR